MALAFCKVLQLLRSCGSTQGQNIDILPMEYLACEWLDKDRFMYPEMSSEENDTIDPKVTYEDARMPNCF